MNMPKYQILQTLLNALPLYASLTKLPGGWAIALTSDDALYEADAIVLGVNRDIIHALIEANTRFGTLKEQKVRDLL